MNTLRLRPCKIPDWCPVTASAEQLFAQNIWCECRQSTHCCRFPTIRDGPPSTPKPTFPAATGSAPLCRLLVLPQRHRHFVTAEAVTAVAAVTTPKLQLVAKGSVRRRSVPASQHRGAVGANPRKPCNRWGRRAATGRKPARRVEGRGHVAQRTSANHFDTDSRSSASTGEHWRDNRINLNGHTRRS